MLVKFKPHGAEIQTTASIYNNILKYNNEVYKVTENSKTVGELLC